MPNLLTAETVVNPDVAFLTRGTTNPLTSKFITLNSFHYGRHDFILTGIGTVSKYAVYPLPVMLLSVPPSVNFHDAFLNDMMSYTTLHVTKELIS